MLHSTALDGRRFKVISKKHPHFEETGIILGVERCAGAGLGLKFKNDDESKSDFFVFSSDDIEAVREVRINFKDSEGM